MRGSEMARVLLSITGMAFTCVRRGRMILGIKDSLWTMAEAIAFAA
jgi:hypothetical protein